MVLIKKSLFPLLLVLIMATSITANASLRAKQVTPTLTFSGTTATCKSVIMDSGQRIDATMELWCGRTLVDSWSGSATSLLTLTGTCNVESGSTYTLKISGTIGGVSFTGTPVSKTCP